MFCLSGVLLLLTLAPANAEIYKWIDRDGRVHFADTIAGIPPEYRDHIEEKVSLTSTPRSDPALQRVPPARLSMTPAPLSYSVPMRR